MLRSILCFSILAAGCAKPPEPSNKQSSAAILIPGHRSKIVYLAPNESDLARYESLVADPKKQAEIASMADDGKIVGVHAGLAVFILATKETSCRVKVMEGDNEGLEAWVSMIDLAPASP